ncbi:MAG: hypothetical protein QOG89_3455, partial [Thermomicrobiales bacterium]|nr:hypothetical protein [Thermomicrobiales bacterium]
RNPVGLIRHFHDAAGGAGAHDRRVPVIWDGVAT